MHEAEVVLDVDVAAPVVVIVVAPGHRPDGEIATPQIREVYALYIVLGVSAEHRPCLRRADDARERGCHVE